MNHLDILITLLGSFWIWGLTQRSRQVWTYSHLVFDEMTDLITRLRREIIMSMLIPTELLISKTYHVGDLVYYKDREKETHDEQVDQ